MHEPITFLIRYQNTGREPAYDVALAINNFTIPAHNPELVNMVDIVVPANKSCDKLEPSPGRAVVPPSQPGFQYGIFEDSIRGSPPFRADEQILNGTQFYWFNACFAYNTFGKPHRTAVCYGLARGRGIPLSALTTQQAQLQLAPPTTPGAPTASPAQPPIVFAFGPCSTGFNAD
jgi:hypothetical protein